MAEQDTQTAADAEVVGETPTTHKDKAVEVEVDGRSAIVSISKERVRLDRHTIPALIQVLQAAFIEVG